MSNAAEFEVLTDWDKTLFDTNQFAVDLWGNIAERAGVDVSVVAEDGLHFHSHPVLGGYEFEGHVSKYGLNIDDAWLMLDEMISRKDYLYAGSEGFMGRLALLGFSPSILSFGEDRFQRAKIYPYLDRLGNPEVEIVKQRKGEYIAEHYAQSRGVLVDDVANQRLPANFTEIHFDPGAGLLSAQTADQVYKVSNLSQAADVIQKLEQKLPI